MQPFLTHSLFNPFLIGTSNHRRWYTLALLLLTVFAGCSKSDEGGNGADGDYYVRFKANGTQVEYTSNALTQVMDENAQGLYSCVMQGYKDYTQAANDFLGLVIWTKEPLTTQAYYNSNNVENTSGDKIPQVLLSYYDAAGQSYISLQVPEVTVPPFDNIVSDVKVTITAIDAQHIAGTFSGTLFQSTDATYTKTVVVTEGDFNLKRIQ